MSRYWEYFFWKILGSKRMRFLPKKKAKESTISSFLSCNLSASLDVCISENSKHPFLNNFIFIFIFIFIYFFLRKKDGKWERIQLSRRRENRQKRKRKGKGKFSFCSASQMQLKFETLKSSWRAEKKRKVEKGKEKRRPWSNRFCYQCRKRSNGEIILNNYGDSFVQGEASLPPHLLPFPPNCSFQNPSIAFFHPDKTKTLEF